MPSIEKRGTNTWRLTVDLGLDAKGERIRERKPIKVDDPALLRAPRRLREYLEQEWYAFKAEVEAGVHVKPEKMAFAAYAQLWRDKHAKAHYSPRSYKNYTDRLDSHVLPYFERMFLDEIKPLHVLEFKNYLASPQARKDGKPGPLSISTQLFIFKVLVAMLTTATDELKLLMENPAASITPPKLVKSKKRQRNVYDEEEAFQVVLALLEMEPLWRLYFFGALFGGCRRGELLALEWPFVDFERSRIFIGQSISWTENGEAALKGTKEDNEEWVDMPVWYMRELKQFYRAWCEERLEIHPDDWQGGERQYVFHNGTGKPYYHDTPTATWRRFLQRHQLKSIRLHDLRHTAATLLLEDGVDLKLIQDRLRHAKIETTGDFYAHVTARASRAVADRLEKFDPIKLGDELGTDWGRDSSVGDRIAPISSFRKKRKA